MLMEIGVNSHGHVVADAHDSTESISAQTHVSMLTHILEALSLLLHGIVAAAHAVDLDSLSLNLRGLACSGTLDKFANHAKAGASGD